MPNLKSAKKRLRQNVVGRIRNRGNNSRLRSAMKRYILALDTDASSADSELKKYSGLIDITARKGTIPKKRADRKKSRAAMALNRVKSGQAHGLVIEAYRAKRRQK